MIRDPDRLVVYLDYPESSKWWLMRDAFWCSINWLSKFLCCVNFSIYPSAHDNTVQIPIGNNTGSLPDLTSVHFPSPLHTPLDQEHDHSSSPYSSVRIFGFVFILIWSIWSPNNNDYEYLNTENRVQLQHHRQHYHLRPYQHDILPLDFHIRLLVHLVKRSVLHIRMVLVK